MSPAAARRAPTPVSSTSEPSSYQRLREHLAYLQMTTAAEPLASEPAAPASGTMPPDPEVVERPRRRRFSAEYRLRILRQADACTLPGGLGALLRREGLYSSSLANWRRQRDRGVTEALSQPRGRKPTDPAVLLNAKLVKENV